MAETTAHCAPPSLAGLFDPDHVAVVGATEREGAVGRAITENLLDGFDGEVSLVNPNHERLFGRECRASVADTGADVAVIAVPVEVVFSVLETCGEAGIRNAIIVTAGFGERGEAGKRREDRLRDLAAEYGLNVVGPNCLGVVSTPAGMNASFGPNKIHTGSISFLSQSGAFVTAVLDWAAAEGIGFRHVVSLGNKAVLDETDFLRFWGADEGTDVVVGYLEDVADGRGFIDAAREVTTEADTPIVIVKAGRSEAGAAAAASHTGAMTGSDDAYVAAAKQAGILRAGTMGELFDAAGVLAGQPVPDSGTIAVVTNAGGPGVLATDAVGDSTLSMADLAPETESALADHLPPGVDIANPVDVIGDAGVERFRNALETVLGADEVGAVVAV
ncbi:acetate--CoA ligase family protein, partial [Halolamina litorea]